MLETLVVIVETVDKLYIYIYKRSQVRGIFLFQSHPLPTQRKKLLMELKYIINISLL